MADLDGNVTDEVVMALPRGNQGLDRGLAIYYGDGTPWRYNFGTSEHPDCWNSVPILDVTGDGQPDVITGRVALTIQAKVPTGWINPQATKSAYQTAWADMDGDGDVEGFTARMEKLFHAPGKPPAQDIIALDHTGASLAGWPQAVEGLSIYTVVGDIGGDDTLEVVSIDRGGTLRAWTLDGQDVPGSRSSRDDLGRELRGALRGGMNGYVAPSLADLDGDGKAEIIALSSGGELLTLKADGSNWGTGRLGRFGGRAGVAVADLGGDGEMDVFAGNKWIRLTKDGPVSASIAPRDADIAAAPSLCDLDGDGKAEVLLVSEDGRVWVFQTDREIKPEWMQWQTTGGSFRHTSAWFDPRKITPAIAKWARGRLSPND